MISSTEIIVCLSATAGFLIFLLVLAVVRRRYQTDITSENEDEMLDPDQRRRALVAIRDFGFEERDFEFDTSEEEEEEQKPAIEIPEGKIGTKKLAKLQAKAEKRAKREAEERSREEKKKAQEKADEEKRIQNEKEREEERKREEKEKKEREEKEKKEYEEYLKLKEEFTVQEEGFDEGEEESENILQDFVNYIKDNKVVVLEDIAAKFKLKTQQAIERIQQLQADRTLTGVIDDRGKFIYISEEELQAVAKFVKQRGRVSIVELVENSNRLINLTTKIEITSESDFI